MDRILRLEVEDHSHLSEDLHRHTSKARADTAWRAHLFLQYPAQTAGCRNYVSVETAVAQKADDQAEDAGERGPRRSEEVERNVEVVQSLQAEEHRCRVVVVQLVVRKDLQIRDGKVSRRKKVRVVEEVHCALQALPSGLGHLAKANAVCSPVKALDEFGAQLQPMVREDTRKAKAAANMWEARAKVLGPALASRHEDDGEAVKATMEVMFSSHDTCGTATEAHQNSEAQLRLELPGLAPPSPLRSCCHSTAVGTKEHVRPMDEATRCAGSHRSEECGCSVAREIHH